MLITDIQEDPFLNIKVNYVQMKPAMKRIADVLMARQNCSDILNIGELAACSGVSNATVTRFVQMLGFENYKSFSHALQKHGREAENGASSNGGTRALIYAGGVPSGSDAESVCQYVIRSEIEMLNDTLSLMDYPTMEKVTQLLCNARQVLFIGEGRSYLAAQSACNRFAQIGILCSSHGSLHDMIPAVSMCKRGDLVIGISNMGRSSLVTECLTLARERGADTVAITCVKGSPVASAAQDTILMGFNYGNFASSGRIAGYKPGSENLPQYSIIDCLYLMCAMRQDRECLEQYDKASDRLDKSRL